ncbi:MAG TPA: bifunctional [glutamate--ammonia ligase]-adenylyl-L-tyrosine phosphorylase/[glutamate--ammonia-ligase] adenylyltransferase [Thermoguttaceae bacterium]|nr:bifunctional [glutamate--ammonia ligase]-adenylyl-L-tyrosine phosphorylase/[glutamate--ammonia-ligase] adenylyltransferase [Thermoguttaceae bacterium]
MEIVRLRQYLDDPAAADGWLESLGLVDTKRAHANLVRMATGGLTLDLVSVICDQLGEHLARLPDPDMALNNLDRFLAASRSRLSVGTFFQRDPGTLPTLLQILSTSQHLSDLLVADPQSLDLLRLTEGQPFARQALVDDLAGELAVLEDDQAVLRSLRRFKRREMLRISYGDIVRQQSLRTVTLQISYLADAIVEAALGAAWRSVGARRGLPLGPGGRPARFVVLGMGKLGGLELNYSSDIDLILLYDVDGQTDGRRPITNAEFFDRLARELVRLLTETTELGAVYRVDLRLRPEGDQGPIVRTVAGAQHYYDVRGRTWERQVYLKARPVAGDLELGAEFLRQLSPWVYRRYLSRADISEIKALKRRIEQRTEREGADAREVKTGHGGIRDVEFVIQFLQLLNGALLPALRTGNTLEAIARLADLGCLTNQERTLLEANYSFLRKIEHRLQIMFDLQTHLLPDAPDELRKLALRMGYVNSPGKPALAKFQRDYQRRTAENRRILDFLLHEAFSDDVVARAEVDLVFDPSPPDERIAEVLGKYPFRDVRSAYRNLMALGEEKIRFLSTPRCRHFLAAIAPDLIRAIAATPDPDSTLVNLNQVSDSLGGKGVLWELFSFNPPSLKLYVELCAYSPFLSGILTSNPGMIDGLMDSLVLDRLPTHDSLQQALADLCRGAEDLDPILHSFKNDQQLRVGVRDLLGKEDVLATTGALSDVAQTCLTQIVAREHQRLAARFGEPTVGEGPRAGEPAEPAILAMGKFGGREMNYHSDLDLVFLYEADGDTVHPERPDRGTGTSNQHFYSQLAQRVIKTTSRLSAYGRLYEIDARLRPTGKSGALATSLDPFAHYFRSGDGRLWERQALCKARVVVGSPRIAEATRAVVARAAFEHPWRPTHADEIRHMRHRLEETATGENLKRGAGGIVDVEFLVQMLQLKHGRKTPEVRIPNTLDALEALHEAGHLATEDFKLFATSYRFLRTLEGRLRLVSLTARDKLPEDPTELAKLAHLLRCPSTDALLADFERYTRETRRRFDRVFDVEGS